MQCFLFLFCGLFCLFSWVRAVFRCFAASRAWRRAVPASGAVQGYVCVRDLEIRAVDSEGL